MSSEVWPLSAAATQLLIDLRHDGPAATLNTTLSQLTVKELIHRGHLQVLSVRNTLDGPPRRSAWHSRRRRPTSLFR